MFGRKNKSISQKYQNLVRRVGALETETTKATKEQNDRFSFFGGYSALTLLGRLQKLEEKFAAVLSLCKVDVEHVETHYKAKRKRGKK
jgi:hypothetical protein